MNKKKPQPTAANAGKSSGKSKVGKASASGSKGSEVSKASPGATFKSVSENRRAKHQYEILDSI